MSGIEILRHAGIAVTMQRIMVLQLFLHAESSVRYSAVLQSLTHKIHRGTLYRIVRLFVKKQLLQMVPNKEGVLEYRLSYQKPLMKKVEDEMIFACTACGQTIEVIKVALPEITLPTGFAPANTQLIVTGTCISCNNKTF